MKIIVFSILTIIISTGLCAQNEPDFAWAKNIEVNNQGNTVRIPSTIDFQGNSYRAAIRTPFSYNVDGISLTGQLVNSTTASSTNFGYIAKYDPNGQIIWAKSLTNIMLGNGSDKLLVDNQGNIYFFAAYNINSHYPAFLDDKLLTDTIIQSPTINQNAYHCFLAKLNSGGDILWVKKNASQTNMLTEIKTSTTLSFDLNNNINLIGAFQNYISFVPGDTLKISNFDEVGAFLTKYNPDGEVLLAKKIAGETYPRTQFRTEKFKTDASGNLYRFSNRQYPNPLGLYRYDTQGELLDSLPINTSSTSIYGCELPAFAVNSIGDIFIGGLFFGDFTLESTTYNNYGGGSQNFDAVLFKLAAPNYTVDWVKLIQTIDKDKFDVLNTDELGNVYALGTNITGVNKLLLQKYTNNGTLLWNLPLGTGSNILPDFLEQTQNGGNIWVGGQYTTGANFAPGYNFTTSNPSYYNGFIAQYGLCNTPNPTINTPITTKICGQDSITLSAHLNNPTATYFWSTPNGAVAIAGNTTNAEITVGDVGKYSLILQENTECYGKSQEIWITKHPLPDKSVTVQNNILTATDTTQGNTYQWLDCDNSSLAINGATAVSFTPVQNGTYAVKITSPEGCTDTSACFTINNLSVTEQTDLAQLISIYPNPAKDEINIEGVAAIKSVRILDLQGKELMHTKGDKITISTLSSGVYLIEIKTAKGVGVKRFVKE